MGRAAFAGARSGDAEQLIGALIPPATRRRPASGTPMLLTPLPAPQLPTEGDPDSFRLDMARPDTSGRLSVRYLLRVLGWSPGDRVDLTVMGDAVVVVRSPTGQIAIGTRGDLMIPAAVRALAGMDSDHQLVLIAAPMQNTLVVHRERLVAGLIVKHYCQQGGIDGG
jgi:hypothetical protein